MVGNRDLLGCATDVQMNKFLCGRIFMEKGRHAEGPGLAAFGRFGRHAEGTSRQFPFFLLVISIWDVSVLFKF